MGHEANSSLRSLVQAQQPCYTKAMVEAGIRSPSGAKKTWVIVEYSDDVNVYSKFFNPEYAQVLSSLTDKGKSGYRYVEEIVSELLMEYDRILILGIRDADYTRYESPMHQYPANIYATDHRDLEMMMLAAPSVPNALEQWNADFPVKFDECRPLVRTIGYMRIFNHIKNIGFDFRKWFKTNVVWNQETHQLKEDWEITLQSIFFNYCGNRDADTMSRIEKEYNQLIIDQNLGKESDYDICQGHDVLHWLSIMMVKNDYAESRIMRRMTDAYSYDDFRKARLHESIKAWSNYKGVKILRDYE